jgi:AcrR family transcriptional regulator
MSTQPTSTRDSILQAAGRVVLAEGVNGMTLEAVAREAGVSKGGLLYHFPNKEALIAAMMTQLNAEYGATIERQLAQDEAHDQPGHWLRAYVRSTFDTDREFLDLSASLMAAINTNPALLDPFRESFARWQQQAEQDGLDPALATVIRLAADGLWLAELFGLAPPGEPLRTQLFKKLLELTQVQAPSERDG